MTGGRCAVYLMNVGLGVGEFAAARAVVGEYLP